MWMQVVWAVGGVLVGLPVTAAMSELPNAGGGAVSLRAAQADARAATEPIQKVRRPRRAQVVSSSSDDEWGTILAFGVGVIIVVGLYAQWAATIAVVMFWVSVATLTVTVLSFLVLYLRRVVEGGRTAWLLLLTVAYAFVGAVVAWWLVEPPLHGTLDAAVAVIRVDGLFGVLPYVVPLGYQLVGGLASFAVLLSSVFACVANLSAVMMSLRSPDHQAYRWVWRPLFRVTRWTTSSHVGWLFFGLALFALAFAGGWALQFISSLADLVPTPAA